MNTKEGMLVFVTIGVPFSSIPIMQKVMMYVEPTIDTPVTVAKALRRQVGRDLNLHGWTPGDNFDPNDLYYEVYDRADTQVPFTASANCPYYNRAC